MLRDVRGKRAVGAIDLVVRAGVNDRRELGGGYDGRLDAPDLPELAATRNEDRCLPVRFCEQLIREDPTGRATLMEPLCLQSGVQLSEGAQHPRHGVVAGSDRCGYLGGACGRELQLLDRG